MSMPTKPFIEDLIRGEATSGGGNFLRKRQRTEANLQTRVIVPESQPVHSDLRHGFIVSQAYMDSQAIVMTSLMQSVQSIQDMKLRGQELLKKKLDPAAMTSWESMYTLIKRLHSSVTDLEKDLKLRVLPEVVVVPEPATPEAVEFVRPGPKEKTEAQKAKSKKTLEKFKLRRAEKKKAAKEAQEAMVEPEVDLFA